MTNVHGELLIGGNNGPGDFVVEIAASLGIIMAITGLYLWWPRNGRSFGSALFPNFALQGRALWKSLHETIGAWMSIVLLFFLRRDWHGLASGAQVRAGLEHVSCREVGQRSLVGRNPCQHEPRRQGRSALDT